MFLAKPIIERIAAAAVVGSFGDGAECRVLSVPAVEAVAREAGAALRDVEIASLDSGVVPERYIRNLKTYTPVEQADLLRASVAVVGLGGLGGAVVEILARAGVGRLILIDGDRFEGHNLNRQLLSTRRLIDTPKAQAAARRVAAVNPSLEITAHQEFVGEANAASLLAGSDVVVDCLDNLPDRFILEKTAKKIGAPLVSAAVAGLSGQVTTIYPEDPGLVLVYGSPDEISAKGAEGTLGCLPQAVVLVASLECAEVLKILLGHPHLLRNRLLLVDLADNTFETMHLV
jgi:molybdopterin/thiamine biosynthesis adenylyltransferase